MATENPMIANFAGLLGEDSEKKFARERSFGKKLLITAWAVEIMAALLVFIAFAMAFDAYRLTPSDGKDASLMLNAILGAVPFLLIAIIEPTKIPLASGLYKVRHWGWKTLIAAALFGLTFVTFETVFTGLERTVKNLTAIIIRGENKIVSLQNDVEKIDQKLEEIGALSITAQSDDIRQQIEKSRTQEANDNQVLKKNYDLERENLEAEYATLNGEKQALIGQEDIKRKQETNAIKNQITSTETEITTIRDDKRKAEQQLSSSQNTSQLDPQISQYEAQIEAIKKEIDQTDQFLKSGETNQVKKSQNIIGVVADGKVGDNTIGNFESWKIKKSAKIADLRKHF